MRRRHRTAETSTVRAGMAADPAVLRQAQHAVCNDIALLADDLGAHSPSDDLNESMQRREEDLQAWAGRCARRPERPGEAA